MEAADLAESMKEKMLRLLRQKESRYIRLKRQRMNIEMFDQVGKTFLFDVQSGRTKLYCNLIDVQSCQIKIILFQSFLNNASSKKNTCIFQIRHIGVGAFGKVTLVKKVGRQTATAASNAKSPTGDVCRRTIAAFTR